jgi:cyclopropane fatty-acyl-phospholipid synthase-like methyltransferase
MHAYKCYTREDALCQTNGFFSLNLTQKSADALAEYLRFQAGDTVLWAGCGDGRELLTVASKFPRVSFVGCDLNEHAIRIARRVQSVVKADNVDLRCEDVMNVHQEYDRVYSTALAGPEFYSHLFRLAKKTVCMFREAFPHMERTEMTDCLAVRLSGSREQRTLVLVTK